MNSTTAKVLLALLALAWLIVQVGRFVHDLIPLDPELLFWLLAVSLVFNAWLAASLFDRWRNPPAPPAPPI